jgi:hypothetical protein
MREGYVLMLRVISVSPPANRGLHGTKKKLLVFPSSASSSLTAPFLRPQKINSKSKRAKGDWAVASRI